MTVQVLGTVLQYTVKLKAWVLVYVDVRRLAFLGDSEVLLGRMNSDGANAIRVLADEHSLLMRFDVVDLVGVASREDDDLLCEEVHIETLVGCHAIAPEELVVPTRYR
jgi:hypothetical protein